MPSDLEKAMESLIIVFHTYAKKEGNSTTLSRGELKTLMEAELSSFLKVQLFKLALKLYFLCNWLEFDSFVLIFSPHLANKPLFFKKYSKKVNTLVYYLQSQKDPLAVDKIMKDLDTNRDGEVNFEEFVSLVVGLSIACEQCYQAHLKAGKK